MPILTKFIYQFNIDGKNPEDRVLTFASEVLKNIPHMSTSDDELYIHIRSGDAYASHPCLYYGQPPLCFYESIINKWDFKNSITLSEDRESPVTKALIEKYKPKVIITDLPTTIGCILSARNLLSQWDIPSNIALPYS